MDESVPGKLRGPGNWKDDFVWYYEVEKGGIFDLKSLYMFQFQWFQQEYMTHWQDNSKYVEDFCWHRVKPDGVQEMLIWWRMKKKINDHIYYTCKMDWQVYGAKPTEIAYNKRKIKTYKAGVVIRVWWWVQWDPYDKWEKSFLGKMSKWFHLWLREQDREDHRDKCKVLSMRHQNELKQWFEIATDKPMPRSWFPEEGFKYKKVPATEEMFKPLPRKGDPRI